MDDRRLRWLARRGMKELDELLAPLAGGMLGHMSVDEKAALEALLSLQDPVLLARLIGRERPSSEVEMRVIQRIMGARRPAD